MNPDFRDLLSAFCAAGVEFIVVGAHALAAHGHVPATIDGVEFEEAWTRRSPRTLDGLSFPVLSVDDLIANKRASGRLQDLTDVEALQRLLGPRRPTS